MICLFFRMSRFRHDIIGKSSFALRHFIRRPDAVKVGLHSLQIVQICVLTFAGKENPILTREDVLKTLHDSKDSHSCIFPQSVLHSRKMDEGVMSSDNIFDKKYLNEVSGGNSMSSENTNASNPFPVEPDVFGMKPDTYCMLLHLSQLLGSTCVGFAVPIVLWALVKDRNQLVDLHGKIVLNWLISFLIYMFAAGLLCIVFVGFFILPVLIVLAVIFPIIGAVKANDGVVWKYPLSIAFFK